MSQIRAYIMLMVAMVGLVIMPAAANAAYRPLNCNPDGTPEVGTQLFYADPAAEDVPTNDCKYTDVKHIVSSIICDFVIILDDVLGKVYCGIQFALKDTLRLLLTLYVMVFAVQLLLGTAHLNSKDIIIRLLKIAGVWAFATQSAWGIGIIFSFAISFMTDASSWVVNSMSDIDGGQVFGEDLPTIAGGDLMSVYGFFDDLIWKALTGPAYQSNTKVIGFFMAMILIYPPMYALATWWLWNTFMALVKAVMTFMMCISAIAFLVALTPIFLSLMLFAQTNHFFETWLRYMISYSLQVVVAFAVIILWVIIISHFISFFNELSDVIFPYRPTNVPGPVYDPTNSYALCPPIYGEDVATGAPTVVCVPGFDINTMEDSLIPPPRIVTEGPFLYYVFYHLITLMIITYAFKVLLEQSGKISQAIAGPSPVPIILEGFGNKSFGSVTAMSSTPSMLRSGNISTSAGNLARNFHRLVGNRD